MPAGDQRHNSHHLLNCESSLQNNYSHNRAVLTRRRAASGERELGGDLHLHQGPPAEADQAGGGARRDLPAPDRRGGRAGDPQQVDTEG